MNTTVRSHKVGTRQGRGRIARAVTALMIVGLFAAACDDATGPETLSSLTITPTTQTVAVGETVQFSAAGARAGIDVTNLEGEVWSVTGGGTVGDSGLFTAGTTPGTSTITVTCGGLTATATVIVTAGPLATITVTPNPATMEIGATQQFTAVGHDAGGNPVDVDVTWSVVNGGGSIDAGTGIFTAGNTTGTFENTVTATQGTISGTATVVVTAGPLASITVTPNPATLITNEEQQFTAVGLDASGNVVAIDPVWSVAADGGSIDPATGRFTAGTTIGTYTNTVTATQGTISGNATVIVTAGPLVTITVTPDPATLQARGTQQFTASGVDVDGNVVQLVPVWSVANGGGTINSSTGVFTAGGILGTYSNTVVATQGSLSGNATVTVTPGPLAAIVVTPDPATLAIGQQRQFTATGTDADGNFILVNADWSITNGGGAIDATTGLFTAGNTAGTFDNTVRATVGAISDNATVIVTEGSLATIEVTPDPATLETGAQQTFTAVGRDSGGNVVPITPVWSVTNGGGTINSSTGVFTAGSLPGTYSNTVRATFGGVFDEATVVVTAGPLATITVTPDPASVQTGAEQTFTAVGRDADGNIVPITPVWSTTNPPGTIDSSTGVFTAGSTTGTFNDAVTATDDGISGSATVTVTAPPPPPPSSEFAILANSTVTCTEGVIVGKIGTFLSAPGVSIVTSCTNSGIEEGTPDAVAAYNAFTTSYDTLEATACDVVLTGTLAGVTLAPGVYCFDAAATLTGVLTLNGPSTGVWLIKAGTLTPGSITGTDFEVVMAGSGNRCNVTWWSQGAATMTDSDLKGNVLAAEDITLTRGTFGGNAWAKGDVTVTETAVTGCS